MALRVRVNKIQKERKEVKEEMEDYPERIEGRKEERDEGKGGKKGKNMKRGYDRGKGIKKPQRFNVSSEVNVKRNRNQTIIVDFKEK